MSHYNIQTDNLINKSQGLGRLFLDKYVTPDENGVTPTTEVGFFDTYTPAFKDTVIDQKNGTPLQLEGRMVGEQMDKITINGIESHLISLYMSQISGTCNAGDTIWERGGQSVLDCYMLRFVQDLANDGGAFVFSAWKVVGAGDFGTPFKKSAELNKWDAVFDICRVERDWSNNALSHSDGNNYSRMEFIPTIHPRFAIRETI